MKEVKVFFKEDEGIELAVMDNFDITKEYPVLVDINHYPVQLTKQEATDMIDTVVEILNLDKYRD